MIVETILLGGMGLLIIFSSGWGGGLNMANIFIGGFILIIGAIVATDAVTEKAQTPHTQFNEVTHSSKDTKNNNGNKTSVEEESFSRKVTNENLA